MQKKLHIKVGDTVKVMIGNSKSQQGKVVSIDRKKNRVIIEGANMIKKHVKPSATNPQGSIEDREGSVHISNVMVVENGVPTRVGRRENAEGKLVRYSKKSGEEIKS